MTREHIGIVYTLRIPMIVIYSKIDITPPNIYDVNLKFIQSFFNKSLHINTHVATTPEKIAEIASVYCSPDTDINYRLQNIPIITVSNVSGVNIPDVRKFMTSLPQYHNYNTAMDLTTNEINYIVSTAYNVRGVGLVVSGVLKSGIVKVGDILQIGPFGNYCYRVIVKGIHNNFREPIDFLAAGYSGCFAIKPVNGRVILKRNMLKNGLRCVSNFYSVMEFEAKVKILQNPSTISRRYTPIIQCAGFTQPAHIINMEKEYLRSHDESIMRFRFIYRPEYVENGSIFVFREGLTKGIGKIQNIIKNTNITIE
jgi:GTPase